MAFVAEDGTGLENANSLCDVAFANSYFSDRGVVEWAGTDAVKQTSLVQATDYLETRFSHLFIGDKKSTVQALSFPRLNTGLAEIPVLVKRAVCEYALRVLTGTKLLPDPEIHASGQGLERTRRKVGPIENETRFQYQGPGTVRIILRPYPAADILLKYVVRSHGGRVIRG